MILPRLDGETRLRVFGVQRIHAGPPLSAPQRPGRRISDAPDGRFPGALRHRAALELAKKSPFARAGPTMKRLRLPADLGRHIQRRWAGWQLDLSVLRTGRKALDHEAPRAM
jgi:hypothetical protein